METMATLLAGHRVLVTGAASGIGLAVHRRFAAAGADVVGLDLRSGPGIIACDVSDEAAVRAAFSDVLAGGPLSDVVHAAGIATFAAIAELTSDDWASVIATNLTGSFLVARESARYLKRGATFTFLSSQGGLRAEPLWGAYCASKFGVIGLMQALARELAPNGIRVNAVCPGGVLTPMVETTMRQEAERTGRPLAEVRHAEDSIVPLGGAMAAPEQVADVCLFLASSLASHVAGASVVVNGAQ